MPLSLHTLCLHIALQDESTASSHSRQPAPSNRQGAEHKLEIGDTVRMQMIVPQSAYGGLQDMPSPSGRLSDRIERLRQRCTEALGRDAFRDAYYFLKQHEEVVPHKNVASSYVHAKIHLLLLCLRRSLRAMTTAAI